MKKKSGRNKEGLGKRLTELEKECKQKKELSEQYLNQLKYLQADYENLQKRVEKEKAGHIKHANRELISNLLPVLDSVERAVGSDDTEGIDAILKQFYTILEAHGLKRIDAVGKKFDPYYHEVVLREKSSKEEGTILEELQRGYLLNSNVIRHSKVKVSGGIQNV